MLSDLFIEAFEEYEKRNFKKAFNLFMRCAEDGNVDSMSHIATMYICGEGVDCDYNKAIEWDSKAVEGGYKSAMINLGITYRIKGDLRQAKHCFEKSLELGDGEAALHLAKLYIISEKETKTVKDYLNIAVNNDRTCKDSIEEAKKLLLELNN